VANWSVLCWNSLVDHKIVSNMFYHSSSTNFKNILSGQKGLDTKHWKLSSTIRWAQPSDQSVINTLRLISVLGLFKSLLIG
jgi:hypothetical protein